MKICVTQRDGIRYFTRFADLAERDKLTVELSLEEKNGKTINIDLTSALVQEYSKHPELGKIDPNAPVQILCVQPIKALKVKQTREVKPAYLTEPQKQRQDMLSKVRQAQLKAVDERKKREAEIAEARALRLAAARKAKAEKEQAAAKKVAKPKPAPAKAKATATKLPAKPVKAAAKAVAAPKNGSKPSAKDKAAAAGLSKVQAAAIKKIGSALAKEEKAAKVVSKAPAGKPRPTAEKPKVAAKAARNK